MNAKETINQHKNKKLEEDIKEKEPQDRKGIKTNLDQRMDNSNDINEFLKEIYYDTRNPASFSGVAKLHSFIKKNTKEDITRGEIKYWLWKQEVYTLHHPVRRKFK